MSSQYKVSKPLKSFLTKLFAVHVEHNPWQTTSVSTVLQICTITVFPWTSHILKSCSIYQLLLDFLSRHSIPVSFVSFAICINLVYLCCQISSDSLWNKHTIPHLCTQFILILLSATFGSSKSKPIFSTYIPRLLPVFLLRIPATIFIVFATKLNFVAFVFYKAIIVTLGQNLFYLCFWSKHSLFWGSFLRFRLQNIRAIVVCIYLLFRFYFWFSVPLD